MDLLSFVLGFVVGIIVATVSFIFRVKIRNFMLTINLFSNNSQKNSNIKIKGDKNKVGDGN